ncbi:Uncharacterized conserved protein YeaO, DUF488 family [Micrococcales bacterium KH10]|nr:Uncharacterized conserved protein YeaO, DUF488 family [Micrococcales bacterium KH10]
MTVTIKRIYDESSQADGWRVLVDRLWPRGVTKERADLDDWCKEVAPSPDLRTWWGHDPQTFDEFTRRYRAELKENPAVAQFAASCREHDRVTLLYGAKDPQINHAAVLREYLQELK